MSRRAEAVSLMITTATVMSLHSGSHRQALVWIDVLKRCLNEAQDCDGDMLGIWTACRAVVDLSGDARFNALTRLEIEVRKYLVRRAAMRADSYFSVRA